MASSTKSPNHSFHIRSRSACSVCYVSLVTMVMCWLVSCAGCVTRNFEEFTVPFTACIATSTVCYSLHPPLSLAADLLSLLAQKEHFTEHFKMADGAVRCLRCCTQPSALVTCPTQSARPPHSLHAHLIHTNTHTPHIHVHDHTHLHEHSPPTLAHTESMHRSCDCHMTWLPADS